jgi:hypothetical protein
MHRAWLAQALERAGDQASDRTVIDMLDALGREPFDFAVGAALIARASILGRRGAAAEAKPFMQSALNQLRLAQQRRPPQALSPLERDVADIRDLVFQPQGRGAFAGTQWSSYELSTTVQPFLVVSSDIFVHLPGDLVERVVIDAVPAAGIPRALALRADQIALLEKILSTIGGTETRQPVSVMEPPFQPVGAAVDISAAWNEFFPVQRGHWGGWLIETFPSITTVQFSDAARTKAVAAFRVGYSGGMVPLLKKNGKWTAQSAVYVWIE